MGHSKIALVTGAAGGIGAALAQELATRGAVVVAADLNKEMLDRQVDIWRQSGLSISGAELDVCDAGAVQALVGNIVDEHGRLDLLINNAGVGIVGELQDLSLGDWRRVVDVNLWGVVHGVHAAYPQMISQGQGQIINVSSGAGLCPRPGMVPYAAAKSAVVALSTSLRAEAADKGVRVCVVCPSYVDTGIFAASTYKQIDKDVLLAKNPLRPMSAERCAEIILRAAGRNRAVIPVGTVAWIEWWLLRWSPWLHERFVAVRGRAIRSSRRRVPFKPST